MKQLLILTLLFTACTKDKLTTTCQRPSGLTVYNIGKNGATFAWLNRNEPAMGYEWKVFRNSDNTLIVRNTGNDPVVFNREGDSAKLYLYDVRNVQDKIEPGKVYRFELKSQCSYPNNLSDSSVVFFTTRL